VREHKLARCFVVDLDEDGVAADPVAFDERAAFSRAGERAQEHRVRDAPDLVLDREQHLAGFENLESDHVGQGIGHVRLQATARTPTRRDDRWGAIHFDRVVYTPIPDATVRLANLKAGQLDFIERVAPSDVEKLAADKRFKVARITEIGYQGITINIGKSEQAQKNPLGRDARVREAFELALDRQGLAQVVNDNEALVGNQWVAPTNAFYARNVPAPKRDIGRAKALLKEAGAPNPSFTLMTPTTSDAQRLALVVQAMTREAGFDVKIQATEFATSLNLADKGDYEAYVLAWSGRPDPDGNVFSFHACKQPLNYAGYCSAETDALLNQSRTLRDPAERKKVYEQIAARVLKERPVIYLYHRNWLWAYNAKLTGVRGVPDGLLRVADLKMSP